MEIVHPSLSEDVKRGERISLDIGAGGSPRSGFYALDSRTLKIRSGVVSSSLEGHASTNRRKR